MSWNGNDNKDPWGRNDTPPEIDEVIKKLEKKLIQYLEAGPQAVSSEVEALVMRISL